MPTCKKKKTESRVRRTRRTRRVRLTQRARRVRRVRLTRKRKGGEPCEKGIYGYDDNYQCVKAGCDEFRCAQIYRGSKPHKNPEDRERLKLKEPLSSAIAAQTQSSQEPLSALMDELSIGANANPNATNPTNPTNPTNKTRPTIQGWRMQREWAEGLPQTYIPSPSSYTPPRP